MTPLRLASLVLSCSVAVACGAQRSYAGPSLVLDIATGKVLEQQEATRPWYPASLTKLLTVYLALSEVRAGQVSLDTPFVVSARADSMPPSRMEFAVGSQVTLDNLIKMMMVKSANDLAIVIAEGLGGSVEDFATVMNKTAVKLGLRESHFMNPNGLPDPNHYSSARDLALVARALFRDFPEYSSYYDIGAFQLGSMVVPTHNNIMGRYPGIDGMKTGFTCAAGFNVIASDTRGGKHLLVVVLGSPNVKARTMKAGELLDAAYAGVLPEGPDLEALPTSAGAQPPDMHDQVCAPHRDRSAQDDMPTLPNIAEAPAGGLPPQAQLMYGTKPERFAPTPVFLGPKPGWTGTVLAARPVPGSSVPGASTVSAYAPQGPSAGPLAPDPTAMPLNRAKRSAARRAASRKGRHAAARVVKSKAAALIKKARLETKKAAASTKAKINKANVKTQAVEHGASSEQKKTTGKHASAQK